MPPLLRFCGRLYDLSLCLYPADLRRTFGAGMSEIFRQQALEACSQGWLPLLRVLYHAFAEIVTVALPALAESTIPIAGAGSFVRTSALFWCLLWSFQYPRTAKAIEHRVEGFLCGR